MAQHVGQGFIEVRKRLIACVHQVSVRERLNCSTSLITNGIVTPSLTQFAQTLPTHLDEIYGGFCSKLLPVLQQF